MTENSENIIEHQPLEEDDDSDFLLDFTTSSAISRVTVKHLGFYIPIFWFSGLLTGTFFYAYVRDLATNWILIIFLLPIIMFFLYLTFIFAAFILTKLFLILVNLVHKPKEGIFRAEKGDKDFEFWCLRVELKKLAIWLFRNWPLPYMDSWVFRWFGLKLDFSSHLNDAWCDLEFVKFGRKVMIGQGAVIMSSMVVGKYLIIEKVIFDDYVVVGGQTTIAPGVIIGKDTVIGAISTTNYKQFLEEQWIYFGIPSIKLKPNKYSEQRTATIRKIDVDDSKKFDKDHDINIEEDKKDLALTNGGN